MNTQKHTRSAFTLVETITALACGTIVLAALLAMSISLQRSFAAVEGYSLAEGDQLRVQDYIAMDCRRATGGALGALTTPAVDNGSWVSGSWVHDSSKPVTLLLLAPNYYDANGNSQAPYFVSGKIQYGNALTTPISYYQSGSNFMRQVGTSSTVCTLGQVWGPTAASPGGCAKAIATNVSTFNVAPVDQSNNKVSCYITFTPRFTSLPGPGPIEGTTVYSQTFLRNAVARQ
jgi:Tfp pilus assembly protein PilW